MTGWVWLMQGCESMIQHCEVPEAFEEAICRKLRV